MSLDVCAIGLDVLRQRLMAVTLEPLAFDDAAYDSAFTTVLALAR